MIQITRPYVGLTEYLNVVGALASGRLSADKHVARLESQFISQFEIPFAQAVSNGTTALHLALLALGIGKGDEVITTPLTFIATANSILMVGATPVFVDIDPNTYCIDPKKVAEAVTKSTKAVLAVNLYGTPCDFDAIRASVPGKVYLIEDAAQSIGARYKKRYSGTLGDIATFSLYATKNITSGEGGVVTTQSETLSEKMMLLRQHGMYKDKPYEYHFLGYNYRMSDLQAGVATAQMSRIKDVVIKRQEIAERYSKNLTQTESLSVFSIPENTECVFHQYPIRIKNTVTMSRNKLKAILAKIGISTAIYYPHPLYHAKHIRENSVINACPHAELATEELLCLPIHPALAEDDQWYIIDSINQILG